MTGYLSKPPVGVQLNRNHPLTNGLVGCWIFNECAGLRVNDLSGNGNHGVMTGFEPFTSASKWTGGKFGTALLYDGVTGIVTTPSSSLWDFTGTNSNGAISFWMKANALTGRHGFLSIGNSLLTGNFVIYPKNGDTSKLTIGKWTFTEVASATGVLSINVWNHIVISKTGATTMVYCNLIPVISTIVNQFGSGTLMFGTSGNTTWCYNGIVDNVNVWNHALSLQEISSLYVQPFGMFAYNTNKIINHISRY